MNGADEMSIIWFSIVVGILVLIQAQLFHFLGLKKVVYQRFFNRHSVFEGEKAEMIETLENKKLIPIPWLRVESRISPYLRFKKKSGEELDIMHEQFHRSSFFLRGYRRLTRRHEITCSHRGYFRLDTAFLTTGDLFGIYTSSQEFHGDSELYVYPRIPNSDELSQISLKWQGDVTMKRWIMPDPILVNGIREYRSGDPQKDIHWGATARTGQLQVKVHDYTVSPRIMLILNVQSSENLWGIMSEDEKEFIEEGIRYAAYLSDWGITNGLEVGFICNGSLDDTHETVHIAPACSPAHLEALMQSLAKLRIICERNLHVLLDDLYESGTTGLDIAVISAYWNDVFENRANMLRSLGNSVTFIPIRETASAYRKEVEYGSKKEAV